MNRKIFKILIIFIVFMFMLIQENKVFAWYEEDTDKVREVLGSCSYSKSGERSIYYTVNTGVQTKNEGAKAEIIKNDCYYTVSAEKGSYIKEENPKYTFQINLYRSVYDKNATSTLNNGISIYAKQLTKETTAKQATSTVIKDDTTFDKDELLISLEDICEIKYIEKISNKKNDHSLEYHKLSVEVLNPFETFELYVKAGKETDQDQYIKIVEYKPTDIAVFDFYNQMCEAEVKPRVVLHEQKITDKSKAINQIIANLEKKLEYQFVEESSESIKNNSIETIEYPIEIKTRICKNKKGEEFKIDYSFVYVKSSKEMFYYYLEYDVKKPDGSGAAKSGNNIQEQLFAAIKMATAGEERKIYTFEDVLDNINYYKPTEEVLGKEAKRVEDKIGTVLKVITNIGIITSILMLMIIGIKYMIGSVDEKAEYKKDLVPYFVGAVLLFGITTVIKIVQAIGASINNI